MRFDVPPATLAKLEARRSTVIDDAFLLDPGFGPAVYLTREGRVLVDGNGIWDDLPLHEASDDEAIAAIVVGAKKTGVVELLELLPPPPPDARPCATCEGSRWRCLAPEMSIICTECSGRGWVPPVTP